MNNRKILSIITLAILIASTFTIAVGVVAPIAQAQNSTMSVSAQAVGSFEGPQIVSITVTDPDLTAADGTDPIPVVTVNEQRIRMAQDPGGAWHAYIATDNLDDFLSALTGAPVVITPGFIYGVDIPRNPVDLAAWDQTPELDVDGDLAVEWPLIQLIDAEDIDIVYSDTTGVTGSITVSLDYDTPAQDLTLDRSEYPVNALLKMTIEDNKLNIDPTSEDSWRFDQEPDGVHAYYDLNDDGVFAAGEEVDIAGELYDFNDDELVEISLDTGAGAVAVNDVDPPLDFEESDTNSGVFDETYDGGTTGIEALGAGLGDVLVVDFAGVTRSVLIKGYTASITTDKASYTISESVTVSIEDNDWNIDSGAADEVATGALDPVSGEMILTIEIDSDVYTAKLEETDDNTGVLEAVFSFTFDPAEQEGLVGAPVDEPTILINQPTDETITITYYDRDIGGNPRTPEVEIDFEVSDAAISLDRAEYPRGATVYVTLADPDLNKDSGVVETVSRFRVVVTGTGIVGSVELDVNLGETGANTGVFEGTIKLVDSAGVTWTPGETYTVTYTAASEIENPNEDGEADEVDVDFDLISYTGTVKLDKSRYGPYPIVKITVTDPDVNRDSGFKETVADLADPTTGNVRLRLLKRAEGIDATYDLGLLGITFKETGANTGVFEETVDFVDDLGLVGEEAYIGATIKVVYEDAADEGGDPADSEAALARITSRTGSISADNTNPPLNYELTVTITDTDRNRDSGAEDEIPSTQIVIDAPLIGPTLLSDLETEAPNSDPSAVEETGDDTGVFEFTFVVSVDADNEPEMADIGDTITVCYYDPFPSGAETNPIDATFANAVDPDTAIDGRDIPDAEDVCVDVVVLSAVATLTLDKDTYSLTSEVKITLNDLDRNIDPDEEDTVVVGVTSSAPGRLADTRIRELELTETDKDTGIFEGSFVLNGEVTGLGEYGVDSVWVRVGDSITVKYDDAGVIVVAVAQVLQVTAKVKFDKVGYNFGDLAIITVEDIDYDADPDLPDQIQILLNSTTDTAGVKITLTETGLSTGIFEETIGFTETGKSSGTILKASIGDTLMISFEDTSPEWETVEMGDVVSQVVKATAIMGILAALPVPASPPSFVDLNGIPVTEIKAGITVIIQTTITNIDPISHVYTVIFQVKDAKGIVVQLSFVSGTIAAGESVPVGASWTPPATGSYTVEVFVVESLAEPTALSLVQSEAVTVRS